MTQNKVLKSMFRELSDTLSKSEKTATLSENYEHQCALYERLLEGEQSESDLVCARCLIALSRSLAAEEIKKESICAVKNEVEILSNIFTSAHRPTKKQIESLVRSRIETLSSSPSDAVYDAVLFLYLSLR